MEKSLCLLVIQLSSSSLKKSGKEKKKTFFFLSSSLVLKSGAWHALNRDAKGLSCSCIWQHIAQGVCGILVDGKCGTLVAWQRCRVAAGLCFITRVCSVILLQIFASQTLVFKNCFKPTFYGCWDGHRIWPSWFGPDFDLLYFFTSLFSKCRCLKRRRRLFPLEQNQNAFYSVHRSSFYRLLVWSWVEDRENIVYMGMTWTNSNWGISIFL